MKYVRKRDGRLEAFDQGRITNAIWKAAEAVGGKDRELAKRLSNEVVDTLHERFGKQGVPTVEEIQDLVEKVLIENGHARTAKAYILYRKQHQDIRKLAALLSSADLVDKYLEIDDWRVRENSNMSYSLQGLNNYLSSTVIANYWITRIYPNEVADAHFSGALHIHDLGVLGPYCVGWDIKDLLLSGFGGVHAKIESVPAKHFRTALGQVVNFFYTLQGEAAGAQAFSNFDTYLAPFIHYDGLNQKEVEQALQEFFFNMNVPTRVGFQTPFTNITLDLTVPGFMKDEPVIVGGKVMEETYGEMQEELDMFNLAFAKVMEEGDSKDRVFTFPIPTYNITKDFDWKNGVCHRLFEVTAKYGVPYFSNFVKSDMNPEDVRSMCCRLRIDNRELRKRGGGFFGANPLTGCYDENTEILTVDGWKHFGELTHDDEIFTRTQQGLIEIHKPKRIFEYEWDGALIRFKHKSLDLLVTPNHRMFVDYKVGNKWKHKFVEARNFDPNNHRIPKQSRWEGKPREYFELPPITWEKSVGPESKFSEEELEEIRERIGEETYEAIAEDFDCSEATISKIHNDPDYGKHGPIKYTTERIKINIDEWLRFFGFYLAEGSVDNENVAKNHGYRVFMTQIKEDHKPEIRKMLSALPFNYTENEDGFVIYDKQLWSYLRGVGDKYTKHIPRWVKELPRNKLRILFEWMVKGDGHKRKTTGQITYWTSSDRLATDVQEIVLKMGWISTISRRESDAEIKGQRVKSKGCWTIGVQKARHYRLRPRNVSTQYYKGKVYCCEVPNHTVMVRRHGKSAWSGNSIGVVTINLPRIGYLERDEDGFFERLERLMEIGKDSLEIKRKVLERFTEGGLYPYSRRYLRTIKEGFGRYWQNHFSTIGLVGMNEALLNLFGYGIATPEGLQFAVKVLTFMRNKLADFQEETGNMYNLEATPAEGTSYRLARIDKRKYPNIMVANEEYLSNDVEPFYTNSSQLPVDHEADLFEALEHQDKLQTLYTGGTVFHIYLGERVYSWKAAAELAKKVAWNSRLPYYTLTPTFSVCPNHGYIKGEYGQCPTCGARCEVYSRVVGYLRPVDQWNDGKQAEYSIRRKFDKSVPPA